MLRNKYLQGQSFCQSKARGESQFWQGLLVVKDWYERGIKWLVGNGTRIRLWDNVWLGNCPLRTRFPRLYRIIRQQNWSVAEMQEVNWDLKLRRYMGQEEALELEVIDKPSAKALVSYFFYTFYITWLPSLVLGICSASTLVVGICCSKWEFKI